MTEVRRWFALGALAIASFAATFLVTRWKRNGATDALAAGVPDSAADSVKLAAMGFPAGPRLLVYVIVSAHCGFCADPETKRAIAGLRRMMREKHAADFRAVTVIGVAADSDIGDGLGYLKGIGLGSFDEINAGQGWLNESLVKLIWRDAASSALVPQVVVVSRSMSAELSPLIVRFTDDSVVKVIRGRAELLQWVKGGVALASGAPDPLAVEAETDSPLTREARKSHGTPVSTLP